MLYVIVSLLFLAGCESIPKRHRPPKIEDCNIFIKEEKDEWVKGSCLCKDERLPEERQVYKKPLSYCHKYKATSLDDYGTLKTWHENKIAELIVCESNCDL